MATLSHPRLVTSTTTELVAVLLMTVGSVVFVVGWLAGVVLLWFSPLLRWPEKLLATIIFPAGPVGVFLVVGMHSPLVLSCSGAGCSPASRLVPWAYLAAVLLLVALPVVVDGWLLHRARQRAWCNAGIA